MKFKLGQKVLVVGNRNDWQINGGSLIGKSFIIKACVKESRCGCDATDWQEYKLNDTLGTWVIEEDIELA